VVRNASALVWDTLYGVDSNLQPQRQMIENKEVSADGLTWTFRLRDGLKFQCLPETWWRALRAGARAIPWA
jgi:peptide/nickel transport system substrate-binding protein